MLQLCCNALGLLCKDCWALLETYCPGCYGLCFYAGVQASGFGKIIVLGADDLSCLCWMGVSVLSFLILSLVLGRVGQVCVAREEILLGSL